MVILEINKLSDLERLSKKIMVNYTKILIPIIIIISIIYTMPLILATFSGPHTMESSSDPKDLECISCHEYIVKELNFSDASRLVLEKHAAAANNTNYTTFIKYGYHYNGSEGRIYTAKDSSTWDLGVDADPAGYIYWEPSLNWWIDNRTGRMSFASVNLENNGIQGIQVEEICLFCHSGDSFGVSTHTGVTVIGCTDIKCHGNSKGTGYGRDFYSTVMTGYNISGNNAHARWFKAMGNLSGPYNYTVHNDYPITSDYLTCIGCHAYVKVNLAVTKTGKYMHDNFSTSKIRYP